MPAVNGQTLLAALVVFKELTLSIIVIHYLVDRAGQESLLSFGDTFGVRVVYKLSPFALHYVPFIYNLHNAPTNPSGG